MRKRLTILLMAAMTAGALSGCGDKTPTALKDMKVEKYVTLGEYKGLEVSLDKAEVDDTQLDTLISKVYNSKVTAENGGITDRAVETGDTVNIDYVGKKDNVAFENGSASGALLTIGSGQFIDGFEDGLIGVSPGETVDLNLTFPEVYQQNPDLAGKAVVFTVTVNFILPEEHTDEVVAGFGAAEFSDLEGLRQYVYDYLDGSNQQNYDNSLENYVLEAFMQSCTFQDMPKKMVEEYSDNIRTNVEQSAQKIGVDADTYTQYYYQTDFENFVSSYAEESARQSMALQAVANAENLNVTDEELDQMLLDYAQQSGMETIEEYIGENPKEDYREYFMFERVMDFLVENAVVANS